MGYRSETSASVVEDPVCGMEVSPEKAAASVEHSTHMVLLSERSCPLRLETPRSAEHLSLARPQRYSCGYQSDSCCNTPCAPACR